MTKLYIIIGIAAVASAVVVLFPGIAEHVGHGLHWITIVTSGHHITEEITHAIHQHSRMEAPHGRP